MKAQFLLPAIVLLGCAAAPAPVTADRSAPGPRDGEPRGRELTRAPVPAAPPAGSAAQESPAPPSPRAEPPPIPRGTVVLHVGSSSAGSLGVDLKAELEERGIKNVLKYKEATYIPQWAGPSMGLDALLRTHNPDLVIVNVGGNEVAMIDPTVRADAIRRIVKTIGDRPCIWVGAPRWKGVPHTGILDVIQQNCAPCRFIDTSTLVPDLAPGSDGIHPTLPERRRWAKRMIQWMIHNRDPHDGRPWAWKQEPEMPPGE